MRYRLRRLDADAVRLGWRGLGWRGLGWRGLGWRFPPRLLFPALDPPAPALQFPQRFSVPIAIGVFRVSPGFQRPTRGEGGERLGSMRFRPRGAVPQGVGQSDPWTTRGIRPKNPRHPIRWCRSGATQERNPNSPKREGPTSLSMRTNNRATRRSLGRVGRHPKRLLILRIRIAKK